ncbi:phosphate signaling complex protein PhoU [Nocardia jinanensis]|uniref:Phosphate-specific transport system accessory protein PhoU n=1 Tax=Nocardia jinanensis TaxID=382504 RepID=A0A917RDM6_9NOCA|nr:phosphate signaling complex protein PhoU [Nocardia jinanensis]GGL02880.1 phosphate transport system regulatory protein PhoU [Nocardia jinanensis]
MRTRFHEELEQLTGMLEQMCLRDETAIATATRALLETDIEQAEHAIDLCAHVEAMGQDAEDAAVMLLALQAPVASELRRVVTALQLSANLARMGGLCAHIAGLVRRRHPHPVMPDPLRETVSRMGAAAVSMAASAAQVLATGDAEAAAALEGRDDVMDQLHRDLLNHILGPEYTGGTTTAVDLALLGRYYERFADHTVEVGRRTLFTTTGSTEPE